MRRKAFWRKTLTITAMALVLWFGVTFLAGYYGRELHEIAVLAYGVIVGLYAWYLSRQVRSYALREADER